MSKTTDALDWAWRKGYDRGLAERHIEGARDPWAPTSSLTDDSTFDLRPVPESPAQDNPDLHDVPPIATETFTDAEYATGWNDALDTARTEIAEHFETLVQAFTGHEHQGDGGRDAVLALIDQRIAQVKR